MNTYQRRPGNRTIGTMGTSSVMLVAAMLGGCATLPGSGPTTRNVTGATETAIDGSQIKIVDVDDQIAGFLRTQRSATFNERFGQVAAAATIVNRGDTLDISIWEAPPAALFGTMSTTSQLPISNTVRPLSEARNSNLPEQMVGDAGNVTVPFVGRVQAAGRTTDAIAHEIQSRLNGKAHDPQVIVRLSRNMTSNVTVVGEVTNSVRMPLTAKGERLLDALASAGGVKQPVSKMTIQITRGSEVDAMALAEVIKDPRQNIRLKADDVVTLMFQPYSFTVLGAAGKNEEIPFEGSGLSLSQALGRMGGLQDQRANPRGIFIFRFEPPEVFATTGAAMPRVTKDGLVPVIYRVDLKNPRTLFVAQSFPIKDKDVVYVTNAPLADFSKFLQAVSQVVYPIATIQNTNIF